MSWHATTLEEVAEFTNGGPWNQSEYTDGGVRVARVTNFVNESIDLSDCKYLSQTSFEKYRKYELHEGDLVVATVGSHPSQPTSAVGRPVRVPRSASGCLLNQNAVCIRPKRDDELNKRFLFFFAKTDHFRQYILANARGAANQARMSIERLRQMPMLMPTLPTQRKIAAILSAYDDLIENNTRRITILEEMAQAIYREWFVNFRFPGHENVKLVDSTLGKIPAGWKVENLFNVAEVSYGFPYKSKQFSDQPTGKPVIRIRDVLGHKSNTYTLEDAGPKYAVNNGDILIGMDGDFHMCRWAGGEAVLNQRVARLRTNGQLPQYVLFHAVKEPIAHFNAIIVGTTVAHLGDKHLREINVLVPTKDMLVSLYEQFEPLFSEEINLRRKNQLLRTTRDLLLPKLISGQLDVEDLDIDVGMTVEELTEAAAG